MRRVSKPAPGTFTLQLLAFFFQMQFPHAEGVPVARVNLKDGKCKTLWSAVNKGWSSITGINTKHTCVTQLLGLLQFDSIPRYPMKGQEMR